MTRGRTFRVSYLASIVGLGLTAACVSTTPAVSITPTQMAVLTGGIEPCSGLGPGPGIPTYSAGTVTVWKGDLRTDGSGGYVLPADVAATQTVGVNQMYRFVLMPGHYVLSATMSPPAGGSRPIGVTLNPGDSLTRDIPNACM